MSTIAGLLGLVFAVAMIWLGFVHAPLWVPLVGAVIGFALYLGYKPHVVGQFQRLGYLGLSIQIYLAQLVTSAVLFGIGYAAGALFV